MPISVWGLVDHALGRLELLLGEEEAGRRSLGTAIEAYAAMGAPLWRAQAEDDLGGDAAGGSALEERIDALRLTDRQAEVTRLIARGLSNREVAAELQVSPSTVKRHLENVYERTGVNSRGDSLLADSTNSSKRIDIARSRIGLSSKHCLNASSACVVRAMRAALAARIRLRLGSFGSNEIELTANSRD